MIITGHTQKLMNSYLPFDERRLWDFDHIFINCDSQIRILALLKYSKF